MGPNGPKIDCKELLILLAIGAVLLFLQWLL